METAEDFYGTHYSKARTWNAEPDTITWYDLQNKLTIWNVTGPGQPTDGTETGLYDTAKLDVYDKYAMFLHGNNGLSRIKGDGTGRDPSAVQLFELHQRPVPLPCGCRGLKNGLLQNFFTKNGVRFHATFRFFTILHRIYCRKPTGVVK